MREEVALSQAHDFALIDELAKSFDETLIAYLEIRSEAFGSERLGGLAEQSKDLFGKRIAC